MHNAHTSNALYAKRLSIWLLVVALDKSSSTLNTAYSLSFRACGSIWFQLGESTTTTIWCLAIFLSLIFTAIELAGREYTHTHITKHHWWLSWEKKNDDDKPQEMPHGGHNSQAWCGSLLGRTFPSVWIFLKKKKGIPNIKRGTANSNERRTLERCIAV